MKRLIRLLRGRSKRRPTAIDSDRLLRVYCDTHRQVEDIRRAA